MRLLGVLNVAFPERWLCDCDSHLASKCFIKHMKHIVVLKKKKSAVCWSSSIRWGQNKNLSMLKTVREQRKRTSYHENSCHVNQWRHHTWPNVWNVSVGQQEITAVQAWRRFWERSDFCSKYFNVSFLLQTVDAKWMLTEWPFCEESQTTFRCRYKPNWPDPLLALK